MNGAPARKTRIVLIDDHSLFREGVARLLAAEPDFEVASHFSAVDPALEFIVREPVDVVLLDIDLGADRGSRFLPRARELGYQGQVLVVTAGVSESEAAELLLLGVSGIFHKHHPPESLAKSIRSVMEGEACLDQQYLMALLRGGVPPREEERRLRLTEREREVLRSVFEGLANKEIAERLQISESSVKAALQQLFHKTGVRTRSQLVRIAIEQYRDQL